MSQLHLTAGPRIAACQLHEQKDGSKPTTSGPLLDNYFERNLYYDGMATHELTNEGELEGRPPDIELQQEEKSAQNYGLPQRSPHLYRRPNQDNTTTTPTTDSGESLYAWRKPFKTPSDSGTEADDEANGALKRLPTPLVSRRIEYQFKRGDDEVTTTERKKRGLAVGSRRSRRRIVDSLDSGELEFHITIGARLRIEVLRRICETALVLGVAFAVVLRRSVRSVVKTWFIGESKPKQTIKITWYSGLTICFNRVICLYSPCLGPLCYISSPEMSLRQLSHETKEDHSLSVFKRYRSSSLDIPHINTCLDSSVSRAIL